MPKSETIAPGRKNIVVLGSGFGGITATIHLYKLLKRNSLLGEFELILVNRTAQHLYTPALYEIASIPHGEASNLALKSSICIQISDIIENLPGVHFVGETIERLRPDERRLTFASGDELWFEYLVVALGAETNFFDIRGMKEFAFPIKTFEDAVRLRNHMEELMKSERNPLKIAIGGAGATGVELASEFVNFLSYLRKHTACPYHKEEIILIEAGPEILNGFSSEIVGAARKRLKNLEIRIMTNSPITWLSRDQIFFKAGEPISYNIFIWSGGVKPASIIANFALRLDKKGGIIVNEYLEARPRIYAIGDSASFTNPETGKALPWNALVAEKEAEHVSRNILAEIKKTSRKPFKPQKNYPFILAMGRKYALSDFMFIKFFGITGWIAKQIVELKYLLFILPFPKAIGIWLRSVYYASSND